MEEISFQTKMEALELYLQGLSTDKIASRTGISKESVNSILEDAREGKFPQLGLKDRVNELHSVSEKLREEGLDLAQAKLGFSFLSKLQELGVEPQMVNEGFISAAIELFQIEKETGRSYTEIASEVKELSDEREKLIAQVQDLHCM